MFGEGARARPDVAEASGMAQKGDDDFIIIITDTDAPLINLEL